jgi:MarR family 2-MHQ and catechol resistance regulon transcriptional repressor
MCELSCNGHWVATIKHDDELAYVRAGLDDSLETMLVFSLVRTHSYLAPFLDAALRARDLTAAQLNVLLLLRDAGPQGLLMGQIGSRLVVTKSNVTGLIDRMERQGLVVRQQRDRRSTYVRLSEAGQTMIEQAAPAHARHLTDLTACLSDAEKQTLVRLLSKLRRELRRRRTEDQP